LRALPTRDALLPILCTLFTAKEQSLTLTRLFDGIVSRYSRAALLPNFPRADALKIISAFTPFSEIGEAIFDADQTLALNRACQPISVSAKQCAELEAVREKLGQFFGLAVARINYTDGVRITFRNGEVAHVRPSGNADELRIYAVADSQERADEIAFEGVRLPNGTLFRMRDAMVAG
jgi:phosphomannomutase